MTTTKVIENTRLYNIGRNLILLERAKQIIREFKRNNIDYLLLKGLYFAFTVYPDVGLRPMNDIDFLVREGDFNKISAILVDLGYLRQTPSGRERYAFDFIFRNKQGILIDIIYNPCQYERFKGIINMADCFWDRSCEFNLDGMSIRTLSAEDHLLYTSWHHCLLHLLEGINPAYDLFYLIDRRTVKWKQVLTNASGYGVNIPLYYSLLHSRQISGLNLPGLALKSLQPPLFKKALLDYLLFKAKSKALLPRYFCQALMMGNCSATLKVLWRCFRGMLRMAGRPCREKLKSA